MANVGYIFRLVFFLHKTHILLMHTFWRANSKMNGLAFFVTSSVSCIVRMLSEILFLHQLHTETITYAPFTNLKWQVID